MVGGFFAEEERLFEPPQDDVPRNILFSPLYIALRAQLLHLSRLHALRLHALWKHALGLRSKHVFARKTEGRPHTLTVGLCRRTSAETRIYFG